MSRGKSGSRVVLAVTDIQAVALFALTAEKAAVSSWTLQVNSREHRAAMSIARRGWCDVSRATTKGPCDVFRVNHRGRLLADALKAEGVAPFVQKTAEG